MREVPEQAHSLWMVVATHPHREDFAIKNLERQNYTVYCPMLVKRIKHARRAYDALRPLFPSYIFIKRSEPTQQWRPILGTLGVRSILRNGEAPAFLPDGLVEDLKAREIGGVIRKPETPFEPGQAVAISGGVFDGFVGKILHLQDRERVLVLLDLLNRQTKVLIDAKMLRSA
jgi:transcriptional antiterminator RfaH